MKPLFQSTRKMKLQKFTTIVKTPFPSRKNEIPSLLTLMKLQNNPDRPTILNRKSMCPTLLQDPNTLPELPKRTHHTRDIFMSDKYDVLFKGFMGRFALVNFVAKHTPLTYETLNEKLDDDDIFKDLVDSMKKLQKYPYLDGVVISGKEKHFAVDSDYKDVYEKFASEMRLTRPIFFVERDFDQASICQITKVENCQMKQYQRYPVYLKKIEIGLSPWYDDLEEMNKIHLGLSNHRFSPEKVNYEAVATAERFIFSKERANYLRVKKGLPTIF